MTLSIARHWAATGDCVPNGRGPPNDNCADRWWWRLSVPDRCPVRNISAKQNRNQIL